MTATPHIEKAKRVLGDAELCLIVEHPEGALKFVEEAMEELVQAADRLQEIAE